MASDLEQRVLQTLRDNGSLTIEQHGRLVWPQVARDPLEICSFLAHLIDHGWVVAAFTDPIRFTLTPEGHEQFTTRAT